MRVHVVGGGLAGLLTGAELHRRGHTVVVSEAAAHVGGVAQTEVVDDAAGRWMLEPAVGSFLLPHPVLGPVLDAAGTEVVPAGPDNQRYVSDGSGYRLLPAHPLQLARSRIVSPAAMLRGLAEPLVRTRSEPHETLQAFLVRRLGGEAGTLAAHLAASGVFAGDATQLAAAAFPQMLALEAESGSLLRGAMRRRLAHRRAGPDGDAPIGPALHLPRYGMRRLAEDLAALIGEVRTGAKVKSIQPAARGFSVDGEQADAVVVAVGPGSAPEFAGRALDLVEPPMAPVAVGFLGGPRGDMHLPDGFGLLTGPRAETPVLGVLFESGPGRAPEGHQLAKVLVGGARHPQALASDDHRLLAGVIDDVGRILGASIRPSFTRVYRTAIPQYTPEHLARVVRRQLPDGVLATGWRGHAIGIGSLAIEAGKIARALEDPAA